jgi:hypothetical protein
MPMNAPRDIASAFETLLATENRCTLAPVDASTPKGSKPKLGKAPSKNTTFRVPAECHEAWERAMEILRERQRRAGVPEHAISVTLSAFLRSAGDEYAAKLIAEDA